jgi:hypothetical protein
MKNDGLIWFYDENSCWTVAFLQQQFFWFLTAFSQQQIFWFDSILKNL